MLAPFSLTSYFMSFLMLWASHSQHSMSTFWKVIALGTLWTLYSLVPLDCAIIIFFLSFWFQFSWWWPQLLSTKCDWSIQWQCYHGPELHKGMLSAIGHINGYWPNVRLNVQLNSTIRCWTVELHCLSVESCFVPKACKHGHCFAYVLCGGGWVGGWGTIP